jgi:hypothetical protein
MSDNSSSSSGIGFVGVLTILFIGLKLGEVIQWSWLWVLSPLWISFSLTIGILLIIGIVYLILHLLSR